MLVTLRRWLPLLGALPFVAMFLSSANVSYDDHLSPCLIILERGALPAADECWECHQPPVYYVVGAGFLAVARALHGELPASRAFETLKLLNLLLALGTLALLASLTRRFFPERIDLQVLALGLALVTPLFLLTGLFTGNDVGVMFTSTLCLWAVGGGGSEPLSRARLALLGALAALAALTKYNALALLPALALWIFLRDRRVALPLVRRVARVALVALAFFLVAGPWFVRNLIHEGEPLPTRMARAGEAAGPRYILHDFRPLALLATPFHLHERLAAGSRPPHLDHQILGPADTSLWTKTFALWWHDALYYLAQPPPALTAAIYGLALPVSLVALFGLLYGLSSLAGRTPPLPPPAGLALLVVPFWLALYFAFVARYPWVRLGHARASFLVPLLAPFVLSFALGFEALRARWPWSRVLLVGLVACLGALVVAYEVFLVVSYV